MGTLEFKIQPMPFFTGVNQRSGRLRNQRCLPQRGQKVVFVRGDWWVLIRFAGFFISAISQLSRNCDYGSKTRKSLVGYEYSICYA